MEVKVFKTEEIVFREDLYPRSTHDASLVQQYANNIDRLPPIEINQHNIIIDGKHRWLAARSVKQETIEAFITETESEAQLFKLSVERNAKHGYQLSNKDKKSAALTMYLGADNRGGQLKKELASLFSVSLQTITNWVARY